MANIKHLITLKAGVRVWNEWRTVHARGIPNLSGANLSKANLSGANLSKANLKGADLSGANLSKANLSGVDLSKADLRWANLVGANLSKSNLSNKDFSWENLSKANLNGANLKGSNLSGTNLSGTNLSEADLSGVDLSKVNLRWANLVGANLSKSNLSNKNFSGINLSKANLSRANLCGTDLDQANLSEANLSGAEFLRTDLIGANLTRADLSGSRFYNTDFSRANLNGADLSEDDLSEDDLRGANLSEANLVGANLSKSNLSSRNFSRIDLSGANLSGANLSGANLSGANLSEANLREANLREAKLISTVLNKADITGAILYGSAHDDWHILEIKCHYVYWDREGLKRSPEVIDFESGEFERLYGTSIIEIEYPNGIAPYQYHSFPSIIQMLQKTFGDRCILIFRSLDCGPDGNKIRISVSDINEGTLPEIDREVKKTVKLIEEEYKTKFIKLEKAIIKLNQKNLELYHLIDHKQTASGKYIDGTPRPSEEKYLAVFLSDLKDFSGLSDNDRQKAVDDIRGHFKLYLKNYDILLPPNTWGDAVIAGFTDPVKLIKCLLEIQKVMLIREYKIRIGADWGKVRLAYNELVDRPDADGNCINFAARLEPFCEPGKIMISENLYKKVSIDTNNFDIKEHQVILAKGADGRIAGEQVTAFLVNGFIKD